MELNDIKKALYKENSFAKLQFICDNKATYRANLENGEIIFFYVPVSEMGSTRFYPQIEAKYLIRWLSI